MNLQDVQNLAYKLMKQHGLFDNRWRFEFDNSVKRFGCCNYTTKTISLSKKLCLLNGEPDVKDTILHEIAHALVGNANGHNYIWKLKCIEIGANPKRCYDSSEIVTPKLRYVATCGGCGKEYQKVKKVDNTRKRACQCQNHLAWDKKQLLTFIER